MAQNGRASPYMSTVAFWPSLCRSLVDTKTSSTHSHDSQNATERHAYLSPDHDRAAYQEATFAESMKLLKAVISAIGKASGELRVPIGSRRKCSVGACQINHPRNARARFRTYTKTGKCRAIALIRGQAHEPLHSFVPVAAHAQLLTAPQYDDVVAVEPWLDFANKPYVHDG